MEKLIKVALTQTVLGSWAGRLPLLSDLYARSVWTKRMNLFHGLYASFDEAEAQAGRFSNIGWDDATLAAGLVEQPAMAEGGGIDRLQASQFAVLLWLSKLLRPGMTVLDLGGAGGIFFETSKRFDLLAPNQRWHVIDVPKMVEYGRARHARLGSEQISFGTDLRQAPGADILLALGSLQYMNDPLGQSGPGFLDDIARLPDYVIANKIAVWDRPDAWTNQSFVTTASPYRIFSRKSLDDYLADRGYRITHAWQVPELDLRIPFHPECGLDHFEGFLAVHREARPAAIEDGALLSMAR